MLQEVKSKYDVFIGYINGCDVIALYPDWSTGSVNTQLDTLFQEGTRFLVDLPETASESEDEEKNEAPQSKRKPRKEIDTGKIKALHMAGWSNVKIADEMHISPMTVGKYVKAIKEVAG